MAINYHALVSTVQPKGHSQLPVYHSVQAAINAAPTLNKSKFIIAIAPGVYRERVQVNTANISLVGLGKHATDTRIEFDLYAGFTPPGKSKSIGTFKTATVGINSTDFYAENLTIENSFDYPAIEKLDDKDAGKVSGLQAVALTIGANSHRSTFNNVILKGYQDTLFVDGGVSYFYNSKIYGHVDFIFGAGNALFEQSTIINQPRHHPFKHTGFVAAPSTLIRQQHGLTFIDCRFEKLAGVPDNSVPLGRPWHPTTQFKDGRYANPNAIGKAVFIRSFLDSHITTNGWTSMHGTARDGSKNAEFFPEDSRFFEFNNYGPGANINKHRPQLSPRQAENYRKDIILNGWLPSLDASKNAQFMPFTMPTTSKIITVTNLNARGAGSLSAALTADYPRRVIFDVAGVIDLAGHTLTINNPNISIHGQTAPPAGITLIKGGITIATNNVLVEHLAIRPGDQASSKRAVNAITITSEQAFNVIINHVSTSWASGKNIDIRSGGINGYAGAPHHISIKNSIIAEALDNPLGQRGKLSQAMAVGDFAQHIIIDGNLFVNNDYQQPHLGGSSSALLSNNYIDNPGFTGIEASYQLSPYENVRSKPSDAHITLVNNIITTGKQSADNTALIHHYGRIHMQGNHASSWKNSQKSLKNKEINGNFMLLAKPPFTIDTSALIDTQVLPQWISDHVGSTPSQRNPTDTRLIKQLASGQGKTIQSQRDVGGYPTTPEQRHSLQPPLNNRAFMRWLTSFNPTTYQLNH